MDRSIPLLEQGSLIITHSI